MSDSMEVLALGQADKESLQEKVYGKLRNAIMSGKLKPGNPVSIRGLAKAMGTSPIPVREALQRLSTERAVETTPNGSIVVPLIGRERLLDLSRTRRLIEGFATELAAGTLGAADFKKLDRALAQLVQYQAKGDAVQFLTANYNLRFIIYRGAGSETLLPIIESLWLQVGPLFHLSLFPNIDPVTIDLQRKAVEALKSEDGVKAREFIEADLGETLKQLLTYFDQHDLPD